MAETLHVLYKSVFHIVRQHLIINEVLTKWITRTLSGRLNAGFKARSIDNVKEINRCFHTCQICVRETKEKYLKPKTFIGQKLTDKIHAGAFQHINWRGKLINYLAQHKAFNCNCCCRNNCCCNTVRRFKLHALYTEINYANKSYITSNLRSCRKSKRNW